MPGFINAQNRIDGTRVTVWDVYLYSRKGHPRSRIAYDYRITEDEVQVALDYIAANPEHVEQVHQQIEERIARGNPPEVQAKLEQSRLRFEEYVRAIRERKGESAQEAMIHATGTSGGSQPHRPLEVSPQTHLDAQGLDRSLE
jgi:uncharacterized protein (DUF433 family)